MEPVETDSGEPKVVFWATSEELPGFHAAADHLKELVQLSTDALEDELGETPTILSRFVKTNTTQGPPVRYQQQVKGMDTPLTGPTSAPTDSMSLTLTDA
jgi:hypothetical protein